jgi:hypothetical protein
VHDENAFLTELANVFYQQPMAEALLAEVNYPREVLPTWNAFGNPRLYWRHVVREVGDGRLENGGAELLAAAARAQFPRNAVFTREAEHVPERLPETEIRPPRVQEGGPAAVPAPPQEVDVWPTLTFRGAERYDDFLRLAREIVDPQAQLLYAAAGEAAVLVHGLREDDPAYQTQLQRLQDAAERLVADDEPIEVQFHEFDFRPHLIQTLRLVGPDQQVFFADNVPNTTPVRDIPHAVLGQYGPDIRQDRFGRTRRTVVDRVVPGTRNEAPQQERLDPDRTLQEAGVRENDELHIRPESTAGTPRNRLRVAALGRVRNEIEDYAKANSDFVVAEKNDPYLPTAYSFEIHTPGFAPPKDLKPPPEELEPVPIDTHRVLLVLHDGFPIRAPGVIFESAVFHPNIKPPYNTRGSAPTGWVCIGLLGDEAYRPDLDFLELFRLITDIASYRNYGAIQHGILDSHGFLDAVAASWAVSERGQETILARGGRSLRATLGIEDTPPPLPLAVRRLGAPRPGQIGSPETGASDAS